MYMVDRPNREMEILSKCGELVKTEISVSMEKSRQMFYSLLLSMVRDGSSTWQKHKAKTGFVIIVFLRLLFFYKFVADVLRKVNV